MVNHTSPVLPVLQNIHFFAGHGADTSEDGDSVASVGGVSLMAGLGLACRWSLMPCGEIEPRIRGVFCSLHFGACTKLC